MTQQEIALAAEKRIKEHIGDLIFAQALLAAEVQLLRARLAALELPTQAPQVAANGDA